MGSLRDLVQKNSPFLQVEADTRVVGIYKGWKQVETQWGERFRFIIEMDGVDKNMDTASNKVALMFDAIPEGSFVKIYKGIDPKTDKGFYNVTQVTDLEGNPMPIRPPAPDIEGVGKRK